METLVLYKEYILPHYKVTQQQQHQSKGRLQSFKSSHQPQHYSYNTQFQISEQTNKQTARSNAIRYDTQRKDVL
jgi:hypothetical protein